MKMVRKKFILTVITPAVMLAMIIAACSDDFLDTSDSETLSSGTFPARLADVELLVNDVYGRLRNGSLEAYQQARVGYSAAHYADLAFNDNNFKAGATIEFSPTGEDPGWIWDRHYENVTRCNSTLNAINRLREAGVTDTELETLNYREGEVRFIRAFNYYYLINYFGETAIAQPSDASQRGVPIVEDIATSLEESRVERSTVGEVWDFIKNDLEQAAVLLANKTWEGNDRARVDIWAIRSFLGKAHVFTQNWAEARTVLQDVIDNSGKSLVSYEVYRDMFLGEADFSSESIFEMNFNDTELTSGWTTQANAITYLPVLISPTYDGGCNGFCNFVVHNKSIQRFGWTDTTTIDYFRNDYVTFSRQVRQDQSVDPRLWVGAQQPAVDSVIIDNEASAIAKNEGLGDPGMYGWSFRKFTLTTRSVWSGPAETAFNIFWLRLADVYLLYAEAHTNGGDNGTALEYINKVKRRAYGLDPDAPSAIDYNSLSAPTSASPGDHLANDPLRYERWAELFAEQTSWWFDIIRWKIGQEETDYYEKVAQPEGEDGTLRWRDSKYALPIPQTQMNAFNIGQNPGY